MVITLKDLIVLKEKLKNTYAYQNSKKLKLKEKGRITEGTEDNLVYNLVEFLETRIDFGTMENKKLNDKVAIILEDFKDENIQEIEIPEI